MLTEMDLFAATTAGELLAALADVEPGPFMVSVLMTLDPSQLSGEDAIAYLQQLERASACLAAHQASALVAAASPERLVEEFTLLDPRPGHDEERLIRIEDAIREEIAAALRWSPVTAGNRIETARLLVGPLAATKDALALGELTTVHVNAVVEAASRLPGRHAVPGAERDEYWSSCADLQRRVLPVARRGTASATRACAKRAVLVIDADGERQRRERARCTRDVFVIDELDGISTLIARMATVDAHAVMAAIEAKTAEIQETGTLIGERRAGALLDLVLGGGQEREVASEEASDHGARGAPGEARAAGVRMSAHVDVIIGLNALLGLTEDPATLRGSGPVAADIVRDLMGDESIACTMRRLVVDPVTGRLLDVGRKSYEIPARLRQFIATRDGTCRFPSCRRRAERCQIDHAIAWDDGGPTDAANLGALCIRHHQLKTHAGWDVTDSNSDGSCTWRSPQGRVYHRPPNPVHRH